MTCCKICFIQIINPEKPTGNRSRTAYRVTRNLKMEKLWKNLISQLLEETCYLLLHFFYYMYLPSLSTRAGCDIWSIFHRSLTGSNLAISFSSTGGNISLKETRLLYGLLIAGRENISVHTFPKVIFHCIKCSFVHHLLPRAFLLFTISIIYLLIWRGCS